MHSQYRQCRVNGVVTQRQRLGDGLHDGRCSIITRLGSTASTVSSGS